MINIEKIGKYFYITSGSVKLARFSSNFLAAKDLNSRRSFYEYWAGSVSTCVLNSTPKIVCV